MIKKSGLLFVLWLLGGVSILYAEVTLKEIRSASNNVLVVFFTGDSGDVNAINIDDVSRWKINGETAVEITIYATAADPCDYHVYLKTSKLEEAKNYRIETPYGDTDIRFREREIFCEAIKANQSGYSALSKTRYANFAIWLGNKGSQKIEGVLPSYEVFDIVSQKEIASGILTETGKDEGSGDYVYHIDLASVPEGGPYKIAVQGYGSSHPFGVGGEFSRRLAHTLFRAQYLQRCGCPIHDPDIRKNACHTLIYDVDGPIGEANIDVTGDERSFPVYGGYHDAGDADRRAYHMSNPVINLMIYEAFPEYFTDGQYNIPGEFDEEFNILNYTNGVPDIIDEAAWGTLVWEYLQNDDGSIHFGTETRKYPDPFAAPLDLDDKKYGTVKIDSRATSVGAGLFMHLARIIKPYDPERSTELIRRAEKAMEFESETMADPERLYYHIQRYLLLKDETDHRMIRKLYEVAAGLKDNLFLTPGYSLNDEKFDNPSYILSYVIEKKVPTDAKIVAFFKQAIKNAADANIDELRSHAYPVGNNPDGRAWGHNVRQPQYAAAPLLQWMLSRDQNYFDAASELMDYKTGLNAIGISYITGLGSHQVHNVHDRESAYTISKGWGPKPGITVFGPGVTGWGSDIRVIPPINELPKERQFVDDREIISFNEFTIFETMHYDALYTVLAGGGKWNGEDPFKKYLVISSGSGGQQNSEGSVAALEDGAGAFANGTYRNLFVEAGYSSDDVTAKISHAYEQFFHGDLETERLYFPSGENENGPLAYIPDIQHDDVRSEGMSYGMMIAVQLDKKAEFDALWNWSMTHMYQDDPTHPSYGFFSWNLEYDGTVRDELPAPDGEEYYVMALYFAANRWGNGEGIYNYKAYADRILSDMVHREPITGHVHQVWGDREHTVGKEVNEEHTMILFSPDERNSYSDVSYHLPAFYELWARWGPEKDRAFWDKAADVSRDYFVKSIHPETGLAPNMAEFDGTPRGFMGNQQGEFREDAWRVALNWAVDWSWWATDARQQELSDRIQAFFESKGMETYGDNWNLDGTVLRERHSPGLVATNGAASLAATNEERAKRFTKALWDLEVPSSKVFRYYDGLLYMMSLLHASGEFRIIMPQQ